MSTMVTSAGAEVLVLDASEGKSLDDLYAEMHELMNRKAQLMDQLNQAALQEDEKEQERLIAELTKLGTATRQVTEEINTAIAAQEPEEADQAGPSSAAQVPKGPGPDRPRETQAQQAMRRDMGSAGVVIYKTKAPKDMNIARAPETPTHGREDTLNGGIANFKVATDLGKKAWTDQTQLARKKAEKYASGVVDARKHAPAVDKNDLATMPETPAYGDAGLNGGIANLKVANDLARKAWQDTKQGRAAAKNYDNMKVNVYNGPEPKVDMSGIALYQGPETPAGKEDGRFNGGIANMAVAKDLRVANWSEKEWKQAASADGPSGHVNVYERKNGAADPDLKYIMRDPKFGPQGSESRNDDLVEAKTPAKAPGRFNGGLGRFAVASDLAWAMWDNKDVKKRQARLGNQNVEIKSKDEILQLEEPKEPVITEMELGANGGQLYLEMKPHEEAETPKKGKQERFNGGMNNFRVANDLAVLDHSAQEPDEEQEKEDKKRNPDGRVIVYQLTKYKAAPEPDNKVDTASSVVYRHKMNMPRLPSVDEGSELPKLTYFPHQPGTVPPSTASNVPLLQYASSVSGTVQPYVRAGMPMLQYHAAGPQTPSAMSLQSSVQLVQPQPMMPAMLPAPQMVPATPMVPQTPSVPPSPMVGHGMQLVPVTQQVPAMAMQAVPQQQVVYSMPVQQPMMVPSTPATPATPGTIHSMMLPMQPQMVYQQGLVQQQGAQVMQMPPM